jgi:hypothetical protein
MFWMFSDSEKRQSRSFQKIQQIDSEKMPERPEYRHHYQNPYQEGLNAPREEANNFEQGFPALLVFLGHAFAVVLPHQVAPFAAPEAPHSHAPGFRVVIGLPRAVLGIVEVMFHCFTRESNPSLAKAG